MLQKIAHRLLNPLARCYSLAHGVSLSFFDLALRMVAHASPFYRSLRTSPLQAVEGTFRAATALGLTIGDGADFDIVLFDDFAPYSNEQVPEIIKGLNTRLGNNTITDLDFVYNIWCNDSMLKQMYEHMTRLNADETKELDNLCSEDFNLA